MVDSALCFPLIMRLARRLIKSGYFDIQKFGGVDMGKYDASFVFVCLFSALSCASREQKGSMIRAFLDKMVMP